MATETRGYFHSNIWSVLTVNQTVGSLFSLLTEVFSWTPLSCRIGLIHSKLVNVCSVQILNIVFISPFIKLKSGEGLLLRGGHVGS